MTHPVTTAGATADAASAGTASDDTPRAPGLVARSVAEGVGSFLVILTGLGATMLATETALQPPLVFGFAVVAAMIAFGSVSGGHFNPAITLGSAVAGRTDRKAVVPYLIAQALGAVAASGLIWLALSANPQLTGIRGFFSSSSNGFGEHSPVQFPLMSAFLLEVVATALLVAVFIGSGSRRELAPFAVGLTYAGLLSFLLPVTNGGINPVRSTASAVFAETWALEQLWLFWAAPLVGALIAGLVFRSVDAWETSRRDPAGESVSPVTAAGPSLQQGSPADGQADRQADGGTDRPAADAASFFDTPSPGVRGDSHDDGAAGTQGPVR